MVDIELTPYPIIRIGRRDGCVKSEFNKTSLYKTNNVLNEEDLTA